MSKPKLKPFDLTMIVIGLVIGLGIFRTASDAANAALSPTIFFAAWIGGGIIALCGALTYAEIGSRVPVIGGYYKIFAECYHPSIAFAANCIILISNAASLAGVSLIGSEYLAQALWGDGVADGTKALFAAGAIALFYGVNLLGLRMSAKTQNVLMMIKIGILIVIIGSIFLVQGHSSSLAANSVISSENSTWDMVKSFGIALIAISFTYGGYQQSINFGDEVENARQNIPRSIFMGIMLIIALYLSVNFAYYKAIGFDDLKHAKGIAAIVGEKVFGPTGRSVFSGLLFIAVLAYVNVLLLSNPRVMFAMSEDGILPKIFAKRDEKRDVLTVSLTIFTLASLVVLLFAKTFDKILGFTVFLDCIGMAGSAATIFILRKRTKQLDGTGIYKMKLYPVMPLIFIVAYIFVGISIWVNTPQTALTALIVFGGFILIYFLTSGLRGNPGKSSAGEITTNASSPGIMPK